MGIGMPFLCMNYILYNSCGSTLLSSISLILFACLLTVWEKTTLKKLKFRLAKSKSNIFFTIFPSSNVNKQANINRGEITKDSAASRALAIYSRMMHACVHANVKYAC